MGYLQGKRGRAKEGLKLLDRAAQLNPMHPPWYDFDRGETPFCLERYEEAARSFNGLPRKDLWHWSRLAAAYALAGDLTRAAQCVNQAGVSAEVPEIGAVVRDTAYELPEDRERLRRGLVLAGWDKHGRI
jgi:tetratricopeptide (TPR) repeat protein